MKCSKRRLLTAGQECHCPPQNFLTRYISEKAFNASWRLFSLRSFLIFELCYKQLIAVKPLHKIGPSSLAVILFMTGTEPSANSGNAFLCGVSCSQQSFVNNIYTNGTRTLPRVLMRMTTCPENVKMGTSTRKSHLSVETLKLQPDSS